MRQSVVGVAVLTVVTSSGCTIVSARGPLISSTPQPVSCGDPVVRGELEEGERGQVRVSLVGENTCGGSQELVFRKDRLLRLNEFGLTLVIVSSAAAGAVGAWSIFKSTVGTVPVTQWTTDAALSQIVGWVGAGVGAVMGLLPAFLLHRELPPGTETVIRPGLPETRPLPLEGALVSSNGERRWPLVDGLLDLELDAFEPAELESASVNGLLVRWSPEASARLSGLSFCRRALSGRTPERTLDCTRVEPALRCAEGGWLLASALLNEAETACPAPESRQTVTDMPPPRPEAPCVTPSCQPPLPR